MSGSGVPDEPDGLVREGWRPLSRALLERDARAVAPALVGVVLAVRDGDGRWCGGPIVETEAYLAGGDPGSHSHRGETPRNRSMFGPAGRAYVYRIYGLHHCFNVVTGRRGSGQAVLVRALEPCLGTAAMARRRGRTDALCSGPGRLVEALGIGPEHDGADLLAEPFLLLAPPRRPGLHELAVDRRVGLSRGEELALRFWRRGSPHRSR